MRHALPGLLATLWLAGCSLLPASAPPAEPGRPVQLRLGEAVRYEAFDALLRFVARRDESRCPSGVECVVAGSVTAVVTWRQGGQAPAQIALAGYVTEEPRGPGVSKDTLGYRFTMLALAPYPVYNPTTQRVEQPGPPVLTVTVDKAP